jgi:protein TonB
MSGPRPLLRLEDKVAAEGRRLQNIGGPSMRWVAPAVLIVAATLHGAILLLPAVRTGATLPAASPLPDFPLVWRPAPAVVQPPERPTERRTVAVPAAPEPAPKRPAVTRAVRALRTEPVPEPVPELGLNPISADVEAIIPDPDRPPPALELGPPSGALPTTAPDAAPSPIERVPPVYPIAARSFRAEGRVTLRLAVLPDGSVGRATVEECSRPGLGFEAAALRAVKRWRYEPTPLQSGPRKVIVTVHFQQHEGRP